MKLPTKEIIRELLATHHAPCISLYMPTHRHHPENQQDTILFDKLVQELENSLLQKYSADEMSKYLEPIKALKSDSKIWNFTLDGLAVFSAKDVFKVVGLNQTIEPLAIVADSFHTKPLRKFVQTADNYHVLCLTLHDIRLYEGNRYALAEIELTKETPRTIAQALGSQLTDSHTTVASYGGTGANSSAMHHGHGSKKEEVDKDAERFFRVVAEAIHENYSKHSEWPLILAALPEHHALFRKVNKNPFLVSRGLTINPSSATATTLAQMAWEVMEPEYKLRTDNLIDTYQQAKANNKGSDQYSDVAEAANEGRVETLLVEANRIVSMSIDNLLKGNTQEIDLTSPNTDDLLDDMAELVLKMGGEVMVVNSDMMPSDTGVAAIFRY